jgi:DNA-binding NarL/FixJ family response regulator
METTTEANARIRVAIVDDSDDVRYLLATVMEVDGRFQIVGEAHTADEGLAMVAEAQPDLVLIDLQLEGHDGTWLIRELRKRGGNAVLAVVTASSLDEECKAALDAGADAVHNKMSMTSTMMDELAALVTERLRASCA